jgi:hypothetical protein
MRRVASDLVISLVVPVKELVERLLGRAREQERSDDAGQVIRVRMVEYDAKTAPVLDHYRAHGAQVVAVDGVGSMEGVRQRINAQVAAAARHSEPVKLTGRAWKRHAQEDVDGKVTGDGALGRTGRACVERHPT